MKGGVLLRRSRHRLYKRRADLGCSRLRVKLRRRERMLWNSTYQIVNSLHEITIKMKTVQQSASAPPQADPPAKEKIKTPNSQIPSRTLLTPNCQKHRNHKNSIWPNQRQPIESREIQFPSSKWFHGLCRLKTGSRRWPIKHSK